MQSIYKRLYQMQSHNHFQSFFCDSAIPGIASVTRADQIETSDRQTVNVSGTINRYQKR